MTDRLDDETRRAHFYEVLFSRRDVRGQFLPDPIHPDVMARVLYAAHHAPSVGLSQPWNFILVESAETKARVYEAFVEANREATRRFDTEGRGAHYRQLRLEGIHNAPVNLCVTCDRRQGGGTVLGQTQQPEMDLYSTVCAVQNLWLAARSENLGMGWVSILEPSALADIFGLPEGVVPVAYVCLGGVQYFHERPELEKKRWEKRLPLASLIYNEHWGQPLGSHALSDALENQRDLPARHTLGQSDHN